MEMKLAGYLAIFGTFLLQPVQAQDEATPSEPVSVAAEVSEEELSAATIAEIEEYEAWAEEFSANLERQTGEISIVNGQVALNIPEGYYFLDKEDTRAVLEEAWGNPPDETVLGMIFPVAYSPLDESSWGSVLTFIDDGYVTDEDAASTDYDKMMRDMKASTKSENEQRVAMGYGTVELIGWAEEPVYQSDTHKLYWAKELNFDGSEINTLNYDVRALGRRGVLSMNFIASIDQLGEIKNAIPPVLESIQFTEGNRYSDYQPGDKKAEYGVAALVAGGAGLALAKKTGFLAMLLFGLKKFGVFILIGLGIAGRWLLGMFRSKSE